MPEINLRRMLIYGVIGLIVFAVTISLIGRLLLKGQPTIPQLVHEAAKSEPAPVVNKGKLANELYGEETKGLLTPELIEIPAGTFLMGSKPNEGTVAEQPQHKVQLKKFFIGRFEITNAQYLSYCKATGHPVLQDPGWSGIYMRDYPNHPVVNINWQEAADYCTWLTGVLGKKVRLPTEAEWEYAAQGSMPGTTLEQSAHENLPTTRVGSHEPNKFEVYDMLGNVWEWCSDWYDVGYYAHSPVDNPTGPESGTYRVMRGGSWANSPEACRITNRNQGLPSGNSPTTGFRVVVEAP